MARTALLFLAILALAAAAPVDVVVRQQNTTPAPSQSAPASPEPTESPAPSESFVPSESPDPSSTSSESPAPSGSSSPTASVSASVSVTASVSVSPSTSVSASVSVAPGSTASSTPSMSVSPSVAASAPVAPSATPSISVSPVAGPSQSSVPTATATMSAGFTPSPSGTPIDTETGTFPDGFQATFTPEPRQPTCFPASATVQLESGAVKRMDELAVGDRVAIGAGLYSEVFMFTHKLRDLRHEFVSITTASGAALRLTAGHYLPVNGEYVPASRTRTGDYVALGDGSASRVVGVELVQDAGLYNPQTTHGDIVVDGVRTSTYTTAVQPNMAHALLAPLRFACDRLGLRTTLLEAGADRLARLTSMLA